GYWAFRVATALLSSELRRSVRAERSLSYAAFAPFIDQAIPVGGAYASTPQPQQVLPLMLHAIESLAQSDLDYFALSRFVDGFTFDYLTDNSSAADQAEFLARAELYLGNYRLAGDFVKRLRSVGAVLSGDGLRARAARIVYPGDELRAGAVARLPAVARLRRHHRSHGQHVLRQPHRGLGDRRRLPARLSAAHGRGGGGVEIAERAITPGASLTRSLRLRDLIFIVVGTVIGSGIFVVPGAVLRQTGGDVGYALLVWVLGGGLSLLGALTYGELGGMLPEAGGANVYVRDAFGPLPAFPLGWTLFFVISTGSVATLAVEITKN